MFPIFSYSLGSYTTSHKRDYLVPTSICPNLPSSAQSENQSFQQANNWWFGFAKIMKKCGVTKLFLKYHVTYGYLCFCTFSI